MPESLIALTEGSGKNARTFQRVIGPNTVESDVVLNDEQHVPTYHTRAYNVSAATLDSHLLQIMAGASLVVYIRRIQVFQQVLATTAALVPIDIVRLSTAGTGGTAITPAPADTTDAASGATGMTLPTVKGTEGAAVTTRIGYFSQTILATVAPEPALLADYDFERLRQKALRIPAGTANGIAVKNRAAVAAATVLVMIELAEVNF